MAHVLQGAAERCAIGSAADSLAVAVEKGEVETSLGNDPKTLATRCLDGFKRIVALGTAGRDADVWAILPQFLQNIFRWDIRFVC